MATKRKTAKPRRTSTAARQPAGSGKVSVYVNGQISSHFPQFDTNKTLAEFVKSVGTAHGLAGATLKINGQKVEAPDLNAKLGNIQSIELVSKETRG